MPTIDEAVDGVLGAQQPAKKDDPIASAVDAVLANERVQRRVVLNDALRVNPDQAAKAKQLERETGVPADVGLRNLMDVELRRNLDRIDTIASSEREASNTFRSYLTRSDFARMSHDDVDTLLGIDKQIKGPTIGPIYIEPTAGSVLSGLAKSPVQGFRAAREGMRMQMSDFLESVGLLKLDPATKNDQMRRLAQASGASDFTTPTFDTGLARGVYGGLSSTLRAAPGLALSVVSRSPTPALATMGLQTQAESYAKYRSRGGTPGESFVGATAEGGIEVATELLPTKFFTEALGKKGFGEFLTGMLVREIPGEQLATLGQDAVDTAIANPGKTWEQYLNERPAAAFETLVATVTQSTVMGGISAGLQRLARNQQTLEESDRGTQMFEALTAMAAQSKLRERDPQTFAQFVQDAADAAEGAPSHVYVDAKVMADVLNQMGISDEQLAQIMPSVPAQMAGAFEANASVEIPLGEALAAAPGTPLEKALLQNARMTPDGLSRAEVDAAAKQAEQFIGQEVDRLMQQATQAEQVQAEVQTIRENIAGQLKAAGRFSNDVNDGYSRLVGAFYSTMAQRLGVSPSELYARFPLRVTGGETQGLAQITPEQAMDTNVPVELPAAPEFAEAVGNTPGAQVTENGLLIDLVRFQKPEQEGAQAIRTGVFYLPAKSTNAKHYKTGATGYGGTEKFEGQTLLRRPLFVKGATGGKAPEAAYDAIKGKGAMKVLDKAVMNVVTDPLSRLDRNLYIERVREFLRENGGEPDLASEIVRNSTKGNTLRYALQEHVIANAVRAAGYDSVVGYSKGKAGAFVSEVFDVREQTFPAQGMDSEVHSDFLNQSTLATYSPKELLIALGPESNYSSFIHELGHFWLDALADMASQPGAPQQIVDDFNTTMEWFGIKGAEPQLTPLDQENTAPVGTWLRLPYPDMRGTPVAQVREVALVDLYLPELDENGELQPEKRSYLEGYTERAKAGEQAPNISVVEMEDGRLRVVDGHRRVMAARAAGQTSMRATVSPLMDSADGRVPMVAESLAGSPAETWQTMTLDQKRAHHERWAESVEQYIFEGKAPSLELQPLFRRFVSWMKTVYGELKRFIASRSATPGGQAAGDVLEQSAFHGTPHRGIDKFSTDKIGTGEGAQAYGWGLYFASKKEVAEWYRTTLAKTSIYYDGEPVKPTSDLYKTALDALTLGVEATKEKLRDIIARNTERAKELNGKGPFAQVAKNTQARLDWLESIDPTKLKDEGTPGQLYRVEIPTDDTMLLWDKPLSEQPEAVRKALESLQPEQWVKGGTGEYRYVPAGISGAATGKAFYHTLAEREGIRSASDVLHGLGIKGIKYLDGTSRSAGDGSFNYVVFSGDDVQITEQFYQRDQAQAGPLGLSDEIRRVMDRLIATDEQIAQAEEVAGMLPEFDATNTAIEKLQARSLANLKWLTRARDEKIRELQRQAKEARAAMRREAYREIMADATMRAWAWLTRRVPDADKVRKVKEASSKGVDPAKDSLLTAIAKMGGLDRESAARLLGVHPDNFGHASGVFGKPVFRKSGGVNADTMGEMLAEVGYLMPSEEGRYDLRQLEEFIDDELSGTPHYSIAKEYGEARPGEGVDIEQLAAGRFDRGSLLEIGVPIQDVQRLEDRGMTSKSIGLHPDLIADAFGFDSGSALVEALLAAQSPAQAIEGLTDRRMLERYGDLIDQRAIEEAANDAVHNEARARALAAELKAQSEAMNPRKDTGRTASNGRPITVNAMAEAMKQFANTLTERVLVGKIRSSIAQHRAAEARAGKAWQEFTAKGDTKEAVQSKRDQALNNYTVRALLDAQAEAKKVLEFFSRVTQGNDEKTVERGRDPDVVNAMRAILAMYGVAPRLNAGALDYLQRVRENDPAMYAALEPGVTAAVNNAKPLAELTIGELRDLNEELRAMWDLAKRSRQMEVDGNLLDLEDAEAELVERMTEKGIPDRIAGEGQAVTQAEERKMSLSFLRAALSRVEQWAERMDGKFGGPFLRLVFQPIKQAADRYRAQRAEYRKRFTALVEGLNGLLPDGPIDAPELGYKFGAARDSGVAELLHAILHTGNESNKRKLLLGRGWAKDNGDGTLDTTQWDAFINRLVNQGVLKPQHYDFAQGVWDLLDELKPGAQQAHRTVYGRYFAEVTANEFTDPFGVQRRGGYVPAMGDPRLTTEQDIRRAAEEESDSMALAFPSAPRGFTKSRVEYNRPLMLDLRTLAQHLDKVILFTHMQPAVNDVRRLVTRKGVAYGLSRIDTAIYKGMLLPWLNRAAKQTVETPISGDGKVSRFASALRARAGMALMFGNISNTLQQITGFTVAGVKVKPSLMASATAAYIANPKAITRNVLEQSAYMTDRLQNETSAMTDAVNDLLINPSVYDKAQAWTQRHGYFLQTAFDKVMSPIIWTAAYNQAVEQGTAHDQAVQFADGVIRQTQGTTLPEDVSRFETGPAYMRLFTQFVGYFNMMANTNATAFKQIVDSTGLKKGAGRALYVAAMGVFLPIWIAEAIAQAFRGGPDDEDKDGEYLDDWLMAVFGMGTARGLLAQVPILGMAAQGVLNRFNDNPADDKFSLSPAVSLVESAAGAPASVYKAIAEDGDQRKAIRDVASAATLVTGLPFYAAARPIGYAAAVAQDKVEPTGPVDLARGLVTGTPSPESKQR